MEKSYWFFIRFLFVVPGNSGHFIGVLFKFISILFCSDYLCEIVWQV
jgi:hypothetical protein